MSHFQILDGDVEEMRSELEQKVTVWSHPGEEDADVVGLVCSLFVILMFSQSLKHLFIYM